MLFQLLVIYALLRMIVLIKWEKQLESIYLPYFFNIHEKYVMNYELNGYSLLIMKQSLIHKSMVLSIYSCVNESFPSFFY